MNLFAPPERIPSLPEFVGLMALMQSLVALTIDAMICPAGTRFHS